MSCGAPIKHAEANTETIGHAQISQAFRERKSKLHDPRFTTPAEWSTETTKNNDQPAVCPYCKTKLDPDSVICVACGRNMQSGKSLAPRRFTPLINLGHYLSILLGFVEIVIKGIFCIMAVLVIVYAGSTFLKKDSGTGSAGQSASPGNGETNAPTEVFDDIIHVVEQPSPPAEPSESGSDAIPVASSTNSTESTESPDAAGNPSDKVQQDEITGIVNVILTSWKDRTKDYENYLDVGYSSGQLLAPTEWQTRSAQPDRKNPAIYSATVFVKSTNPAGKPIEANWTFKFNRVDGAWKLASWFE